MALEFFRIFGGGFPDEGLVVGELFADVGDDFLKAFDELVEIDDLAKFQALGGGGSDMTPAMLRLADDPTVDHVIVMTDGWIDYPPTVPYDVLWALSEENDEFQPEYGRVIPITED